jgi:hypothetical protein
MHSERALRLTRLFLFLLVLLSAVRVEPQELAPPQSAAPAPTMTLFRNEAQAQAHCPKDTIVWINLSSGVYHFKGERWYANTKNGAFVCEQEADKTGGRATQNGQ